MTADDTVARALADALGGMVLAAEAIPERYWTDATGHAPCRPLALVRPRSTADVATALRLCNQHRCPVIPQGGLSGLAAGAVPSAGSVAISLEHLSGDIEVDATAATLTAGAGNTLVAVQEAARDAGLRYPVDLGSRGSCQIGGNVATNAGGHAVLRHGMTRDRVLGLEVVLADGSVLDLMNTMVKNNAGYDLKQWFIGSEGTLGVITRVVLKLAPRSGETHTFLCAVRRYEDAIGLLGALRTAGLPVEAFEVMWQDFYVMSCGWLNGSPPLDTDFPLYVLCEVECEAAALENALEPLIDDGRLVDVVLASSGAQAAQLWRIREATGEFPSRLDAINFDVSLPIARIDAFVTTLRERLQSRWPDCMSVAFGHIGDSNLHWTVDGNSLPENTAGMHYEVEALVYALVGAWGGSISAEHGIGLLKRDFLHYSVNAQGFAAMRTIKHSLDPHGILNPGKVFTV